MRLLSLLVISSTTTTAMAGVFTADCNVHAVRTVKRETIQVAWSSGSNGGTGNIKIDGKWILFALWKKVCKAVELEDLPAGVTLVATPNTLVGQNSRG
ncbi:uncharacterized protein PgNI_07597 [Pyricularia grisea]|uniref:Uncharacterized protein n=1 Tax=Pyricularia grisea TaxID=148305 RepID=A0A6P8B3G2_PYRGI|nr:uncharacterized protein PgNI_07597 [Pyricularia grisea]TLD09233.1 hypothetical protein PgNI_07597 [Pyricularia grisea]